MKIVDTKKQDKERKHKTKNMRNNNFQNISNKKLKGKRIIKTIIGYIVSLILCIGMPILGVIADMKMYNPSPGTLGHAAPVFSAIGLLIGIGMFVVFTFIFIIVLLINIFRRN